MDDKIEAWLKNIESKWSGWVDGDEPMKLLALVRVYRKANQFYSNDRNWFDGDNSTPIDHDDGYLACDAEEKAKNIIKG